MENKTIIDDVNVRECEQSSYDCDVNGNPVTRIKCKRRYQDRIYFCDEFENCYFKQLKRAEQENKRLLEIINAKPLETVDMDCAFEIEKLKEQLQAKEQELKPFKAPCFKGLDNQIIAGNAKKSIRLTTENRKLEDALDEIEKMAKNDCENCCECTTEFNLQESCSIYEIQNIINKAKGGK